MFASESLVLVTQTLVYYVTVTSRIILGKNIDLKQYYKEKQEPFHFTCEANQNKVNFSFFSTNHVELPQFSS